MDKRKRYGLYGLGALVIILIASGFFAPGDEKDAGPDYAEEPSITVEMEDGQLQTMGLEEYVQGVVAGEVFPDWPMESYKAQAIIARTYALYELTDGNTKNVAEGRISASFREAQEYAPEKITEEIRQAVNDTRGLVAVYEDRFIRGFFHAASGGITSTAEAAGLVDPGEEPPYTRVIDGREKEEHLPDDVIGWEATIPIEQVRSTLAAMGHDVGSIENVRVSQTIQGERAQTLQFTTDDEIVEVNAGKFRTELDPQQMRSTVIENIDITEAGLEVSGRGYGHGVGLSQWGAYSMAEDGIEAETIVRHYYDGIEIGKLYE